MFIGCHVSIAGGVFKAPERAAELGAQAMQIFTRSPQGGKAPELTPEIISDCGPPEDDGCQIDPKVDLYEGINPPGDDDLPA